ncbi:MAG: TRASH domain-containing protein [Thermoprotei archaeon]
MYSVRNLTDVELKVLNRLYEDARIPVVKLAKELGVSRSTVSRTIDSLLGRGVISKFTVDVNYLGGFRVFARFQNKPEMLEAYELLDGTYLGVFSASSLMDLKRVFDRVGTPLEYMIAVQAYRPKSVSPVPLVCDKCGKQILEQPYIYKKGRKTYYACCTTCLEALKQRMDKKRRV